MQISNVVDLAAVTWEHYIPFGIPGRNLNKEGSMSYNTIRHQGREDHPRRNNRHRHKNCYYKPRGLQHSMTHIMSTSLLRNDVTCTWSARDPPTHGAWCTQQTLRNEPPTHLLIKHYAIVPPARDERYATDLPHVIVPPARDSPTQ